MFQPMQLKFDAVHLYDFRPFFFNRQIYIYSYEVAVLHFVDYSNLYKLCANIN